MPKITAKYVRDVTPTAKDKIYWDSRLQGYGLRVKPSGQKSFVIQYRNSYGQSKRKTVGPYPKITADQAFKNGKELLAEATLGTDHVSEHQEKRQALTIEQLCNEYFDKAKVGNVLTKRGVAKASSTLASDEGRIKRHIIPLLGPVRVRDLSRADIRRFLEDVTDGKKTARSERTTKTRGKSIVTGGGGTAKRTVGLLSGILTYAVERDYIDTNPAHGIQLPKDNVRAIENLEDKYRALGHALRIAEEIQEPWQSIGIIRLCAFTGLRRGEAVNLTWKEVDIDGSCLRLKTSKTGASVRPMGAIVANLLTGIKDRKQSGKFVFPGIRVDGAAFGGIPRAWDRITHADELEDDERLELDGFTLHGLRHGFATTADTLGLTIPTVAALLGHSAGGVTAGYISRVDTVLAAAADRVANQVARQMGEPGFGEVVSHPRFVAS